MSVFKVKLNNIEQGRMDTDVHGVQFPVSHARTIHVMGPNRIMRELKDGDTFTDCNYYKRYTNEVLPLSEAFLEVVTDDGSVWSDIPEENTYPKAYALTVVDGTTYEDNVADILSDTGSFAQFTQVTNKHATIDIKMKVNGLAVMDLKADSMHIFHNGDLSISKLEFDNTSGGADVDVEVFVGVRSIANT